MAKYPDPKSGKKSGEPAKRPGTLPLSKTLDKADVLRLMKVHRGNVSRLADCFGCERHSMSTYIDKDEDLKQALKDSRERWIDDIEVSVLNRAAESNDTALQCFVLKTQAKHKGWEQSEAKDVAQDVAKAAFDYILNKSKNPATGSTT